MHPDFHVLVNHPNYDGGGNRILFVGHDGGISRVPDALGNSYTDLNNNLGITQLYGVAVSANGAVVVGGTQDNGTLRYTGNPQAWNMTFGVDGGFCASDPNDPNYLYGEIYFSQIFRSSNGGGMFVVTQTQAEFLAPAKFNDQVVVTARLAGLTRATFDIEQNIYLHGLEGTPLVRGGVKAAFLNADTLRPLRVPAKIFEETPI
jgi:hypothetical protein